MCTQQIWDRKYLEIQMGKDACPNKFLSNHQQNSEERNDVMLHGRVDVHYIV